MCPGLFSSTTIHVSLCLYTTPYLASEVKVVETIHRDARYKMYMARWTSHCFGLASLMNRCVRDSDLL